MTEPLIVTYPGALTDPQITAIVGALEPLGITYSGFRLLASTTELYFHDPALPDPPDPLRVQISYNRIVHAGIDNTLTDLATSAGLEIAEKYYNPETGQRMLTFQEPTP